MSIVQRCVVSIVAGLLFATAASTPALAYAIGVQTYINGFPMMDLYRTLWET